MCVFSFRALTVAAVTLALASFGSSSFAEEEGSFVSDDDEMPTLFAMPGGCATVYAAELKASGVDSRMKELGSFRAMASFLSLPPNVAIKHLLLIDGFVIANHVPPPAIKRVVADLPKIKGLIGPSECPTDEDHRDLDAMEPATF